ncbi:hypothetical protein GQ457_14G013270 [Hibiscus cannabinus]
MSSFDENEGVNFVFVDLMMVSDEEERQNPTTKKSVIDEYTGKRKRKSKWWTHFSVDEEDHTFASCKYCQKLIGCKTKNGTTPLANHISRCKKYPPNLDKKQKMIDFESETLVKEDGIVETISVPKLWKFDHDLCRKKLAKMLIVDELPFSFVEREGFIEFCKALNPLFKLPSRTTATRYCYTLFIEQRNDHSGQFIGRAVEKCLIEWGLKNIKTKTVDNASSNDLVIEYLRRRLNIWESSLLEGRYLHMRCASHILNLIVKEGLKELDLSIMKVRDLVRYVRSSPATLKKFKTCIEEEKEDSKSLVTLDVETR